MFSKIKNFLFSERGNVIFRFIDRYIGIILIFILGLFIKKSKGLNFQNISKILKIRFGAIGDTLLMIPNLKEIKQKLPHSYICFLCSKGNIDVVKKLKEMGLIDSYHVIDISKLLFNPFYFVKTILKVRSKKYDILFDYEPWARISALFSFFIKSKWKVGFKKENQYRHYVFNVFIEHDSKIHELENYKNLLRVIGLESNYKPEFYISDLEIKRVERNLKNKGIDKFVLFHPWPAGYKSYLKEWEFDKWVCLGKKIVSKNFWVIIVGGNKDREKSNFLANMIGNKCISLAGDFSLDQTAALIKNAFCIICVNSGIMHLASIIGTNVIALNGPTDYIRWGGIGKNVININSPAFCSPCLDLGFEYKCRKNNVKEGLCMNLITVDMVISAFEKIIESKNIYI